MSLSGTHTKRNSLSPKEFKRDYYYELCSFLYILDIKGFLRGIDKERMYKKAAFYTYACNGKDSIYSKNPL